MISDFLDYIAHVGFHHLDVTMLFVAISNTSLYLLSISIFLAFFVLLLFHGRNPLDSKQRLFLSLHNQKSLLLGKEVIFSLGIA